MQARLLLGPAGSGKTFRCLAQAREELSKSPVGHPLVFIAPRQATYQVERRLLAAPEIEGYTRFHVLSFQRLPNFIFNLLQRPPPAAINKQGRVMVLRALLSKHREKLKVFRASARLAGFSAQLSSVLEEFQRNQLTPQSLREIAAKVRDVEGLDWKIMDLAALLEFYMKWLASHALKDADSLLDLAANELRRVSETPDLFDPGSRICIDSLWVDGFAEFSPQELEMLSALIPFCRQFTLTLCLDRVPSRKSSWLSSWSVVEQAYFHSRKRFEAVPGVQVLTHVVERNGKNRFDRSPALKHLEAYWNDPIAFAAKAGMRKSASAANYIEASHVVDSDDSSRSNIAADEDIHTAPVRLVTCKNPEAEAVFAAREILRHVRAGGRYREVAVLVRKLHDYHACLRRILTRYGIPFFLDRREPVAHHPAVELTRSALRTVSMGWQRNDFFAALKTGFMPVTDEGIDHFENEALARGWEGAILNNPVSEENEPELRWLQPLLKRILPPFHGLETALAAAANKPNGPQLGKALREFWSDLRVEDQLLQWSDAGIMARASNLPPSLHSTVWQGMDSLLQNMELAFRDEALSIREWLPVLEAAFADFSVGIIPPALDQVLIGTVDRSRDSDIKLALVLGLNETVFPALPDPGSLLTEADCSELERLSVLSNASLRAQLGRERFYAYLACTRPRERLVLTFAGENSDGGPLNPSPFIAHIQRLFPSTEIERFEADEPEHACELVAPLMKAMATECSRRGEEAEGAGGRTDPPPHVSGYDGGLWTRLAALPGLAEIVKNIRELGVNDQTSISSDLARQIYGRTLRTSVSRIEEYAACPFKFFVHSALRAQERQQFELDLREQGNFQHEALALFHAELRRDGLRWRDLTPAQGRERITRAAASLLLTYGDGLFQSSERTRFMGQMLAASLQDFVETLVEWMREQYQFDPVAVELPFGDDNGLPAYEISVGPGEKLAFKGRVDRVDLWQAPGSKEAFCVVVDYKSSQKQLDPVLLEHGLQLQLLTYLNVLRRLPDAEKFFGVKCILPAGVFYVSLKGKYPRKETRDEALDPISEDRKSAYQHTGRFDIQVLSRLDARPNAARGDQFAFRLKADGVPWKSSKEVMESDAFMALLDLVEASLREMGGRIFSGSAEVSPFRKGSLTACAHCDYRAICRVDPWTQEYRVLKATGGAG